MNNAKLYIFSGLPASGKSTLAKKLSSKINATYLRIDSVEQGLKDVCGLKKVEGEGYRLSYVLAEDNLRLGNSVVADSVNPIELSRNEWNNVARSAGVEFVNIEVICSDELEHKKRAESRVSEVKNLKSPTWEQIKNREYHAWSEPRVTIDTSQKSIEESLEDLLLELKLSQ